MADEAEFETRNDNLYSTIKRKLVVSSLKYGAKGKENGTSNGQTALKPKASRYSDQPLDLSQEIPQEQLHRHRMDSSSSDDVHVHQQSPRKCEVLNIHNGVPEYIKQEKVVGDTKCTPNGSNSKSPNVPESSVSPQLPQVAASVLPARHHIPVDPIQILPEGDKGVRPFKAYSRDHIAAPIAYNAMPMNGLVNNSIYSAVYSTLQGDDGFKQFRENMLEQKYATGRRINTILNSKNVTGNGEIDPKRKTQSPTNSTSSVESPKSNDHDSASAPENGVPEASPTETTPNGSDKPQSRKRNRTSEEVKDNGYWERRRKNNEAAKRSRDARRAKEDEIAIRAAYLEQENLRLRIQLAAFSNPQSVPSRIYHEGDQQRMESFRY